jgi:hypothetical protein
MTQDRASSPEQALARLLSITGRAAAATPGPWGDVRPSGIVCAPDASDVAHSLHDPDATFIAHARTDVPWLLDELQVAQAAHRVAQARLQGRLDWLETAIGQANQELNKLPWQGDGLRGFVAEGLDPDQARWVGQVLEAVASALDPKGLGLKDGGS